MEGIVDGAATDSCFLCGLLYPRGFADDCPRCGRRMRYEVATVMDAVALERAVAAALDRYRCAGGAAEERARAALADLLDLLHRFAPDAADALCRQRGPTVADLRRAWERLGGAAPP